MPQLPDPKHPPAWFVEFLNTCDPPQPKPHNAYVPTRVVLSQLEQRISTLEKIIGDMR